MLNCRSPLTRLTRIIGALLLVFLAGCSTLRTGYNSADTLLYWWLDSYVDFSDAQTQLVRDSLGTLHSWHRKQELPAYAELLDRMQPLASGSVTPELVCTFATQVRTHIRRLGDQSAEGLARVVPTLQPQQLQRLAEQFEKDNQKWREKWLDGTPDELLDRRLERAVDRFEDFYGRLSDAQRTLLRQRLASSSYDARAAWAERLRRQEDMLGVFQEHRGADRATHVRAEMLALLQRSLDSSEPKARARTERLLQEGCETIALLHNSANAKQRRHLIEKLQGYGADFRALVTER